MTFHRNTTISVILSAVSLGLSGFVFFAHPAFDYRLVASILSLLAFGAAMSEFPKYASHYQFVGVLFGLLTLGASLDHAWPSIPYFSMALFLSFFIFRSYVFRRWLSETDSLWLSPVISVVAFGLYVAANLNYEYGWKGWVLPVIPLVILAGFSVKALTSASAQLKFVKNKKQNIEIGKPAPLFSLPDIHGATVSLADFIGKRHVLMVFIRGDWCPSCRIKLRTYEKNREKFMEKDVQLLTISPSAAEGNREMAKTIGIEFNVLCDVYMEVARHYGVQMLSDSTDSKAEVGLPLPASFLIDKNGIVRYTSRPDRIGEFLDPTTIFPVLESLN